MLYSYFPLLKLRNTKTLVRERLYFCMIFHENIIKTKKHISKFLALGFQNLEELAFYNFLYLKIEDNK